MKRIARTFVVLMAFVMPLFLSACADFFDFDDYEGVEWDEEENYKRGVFTGDKGEWVIFQK